MKLEIYRFIFEIWKHSNYCHFIKRIGKRNYTENFTAYNDLLFFAKYNYAFFLNNIFELINLLILKCVLNSNEKFSSYS